MQLTVLVDVMGVRLEFVFAEVAHDALKHALFVVQFKNPYEYSPFGLSNLKGILRPEYTRSKNSWRGRCVALTLLLMLFLLSAGARAQSAIPEPVLTLGRGEIVSAAWSPDGENVWIGTTAGTWQLDAHLQEIAAYPHITYAALSPTARTSQARRPMVTSPCGTSQRVIKSHYCLRKHA